MIHALKCPKFEYLMFEKMFRSSIRKMTREDIEICQITFKLIFCCNLFNRSEPLVCPPVHQHFLAVSTIF